MEKDEFEKHYRLERDHWWFAARRRLIRSVLGRLPLPPAPEILDVGCGTGIMLETLSHYGTVSGFDPSPEAIRYSQLRLADKSLNARLEVGQLPDRIPFTECFDLITAFDVLEHVEDHRGAVSSLQARLCPNAYLMITVPAFPFLWSGHDVYLHHYRRYTKASLLALFGGDGFQCVTCTYFNSLLFPPLAAVRLSKRYLSRGDKPPSSDLSPVSPVLNVVLREIMAGERLWLGRRESGVPFGLSLLAVFRRV